MRPNKTFTGLTAAIAMLAATMPLAYAETAESPLEFSANVALTTEYVFRGISQTNEDPAIQGGMDVSYSPQGWPVSLYAGLWASNLEFGLNPDDEATIEIDFYAGFTGEIPVANGIGWDIGGLYYAYPGSDEIAKFTDDGLPDGTADFDYAEVYGTLSYDFGPAALSVGVNYSPDYFAESGDGIYLYSDLDIPLPYGFSIGAHGARQWIDNTTQFGTPDYYDWRVGVSKELGRFNLDVSYYDTDIDDEDCFGGSQLCDARVVFAVSSSW